MNVTYSRFTPNLPNGENVSFHIGEKVVYKEIKSGNLVEIIIDSNLVLANNHAGAHKGKPSYDCIFTDTGERAGAIADRIIWWKGKPEVKPKITNNSIKVLKILNRGV